MGCGRFTDGAFELFVCVNYAADDTDLVLWKRALKKAGELLYHATDGQIRIGRYWIANNGYGLTDADIICYETGSSSFSSIAGPGLRGFEAHLEPPCKNNPMTIVHELSHYLFGLRDEYTGPRFSDEIVEDLLLINLDTIPIDNPARANNALQGMSALLRRGSVLERMEIVESTAEYVRVQPAFSFLSNPGSSVEYEDRSKTCLEEGEIAVDGYVCIMQDSHRAGHYIEGTDTYVAYGDVGPPGTDFCSPNNHETPNTHGDSSQQDHHGKSCWEVISQMMSENYGFPIAQPDPPSIEPEASWETALEPQIENLVEERRIALVLDRSRSMIEDEKMSRAKIVADYWLDRLRTDAQMGLDDINIAFIPFNHTINDDEVIGLTGAGDLDDIGASELLDDIQPTGATNIRDALSHARQMLTASPRAAQQTVLLLTDGMHNTPADSHPREQIGALVEDGVRIFSIAFGSDDTVDMQALQELAAGTCGGYPMLSGEWFDASQLALIYYNYLLHGLSEIFFELVGPVSASDVDPELEDVKPSERPGLDELCKRFSVGKISDLLGQVSTGRPIQERFRVVPAYVEEDAAAACFTLSYPDPETLWLYLIDPEGVLATPDMDKISMVVHQGYTYLAVERPKPGLWNMVAFRPSAGGPINYAAHASIANSALSVSGTVNADNSIGSPVRISANATWDDPLSGLRVEAEIQTPTGGRQVVLLSDKMPGESDSGNYVGYMETDVPGRYQGVIRISGSRKTTSAMAWHRLSHMEGDRKIGASIDLGPQKGRFQRVIPISFHVGPWPTPVDLDKRWRPVRRPRRREKRKTEERVDNAKQKSRAHSKKMRSDS